MKERATNREVAAHKGGSRPEQERRQEYASPRLVIPTAAIVVLAAFVATLAALVIPNVISLVRG